MPFLADWLWSLLVRSSLRRAVFWSSLTSGPLTFGRGAIPKGLNCNYLRRLPWTVDELGVIVQPHRSRLETRAKEYSMCASLRGFSRPEGKVKAKVAAVSSDAVGVKIPHGVSAYVRTDGCLFGKCLKHPQVPGSHNGALELLVGERVPC